MQYMLENSLEDILRQSDPDAGRVHPRGALETVGRLFAAARAHVPAYRAFAAQEQQGEQQQPASDGKADPLAGIPYTTKVCRSHNEKGQRVENSCSAVNST
jgi:hypothetical protein